MDGATGENAGYGKKACMSLSEEVREYTAILLTARMKEARDDVMVGTFAEQHAGQIATSSDGGYLNEVGSAHGTVHVLCKNNGLLVSLAHYSFDKSLKDKAVGFTVGFEGSAKSAEALLTKIAYQDLLNAEFPADFAVVDGDGACRKSSSRFTQTLLKFHVSITLPKLRPAS